jgi:hypothetical protein
MKNQPSDSNALALARHAAASWIAEALKENFTVARACALASERTWGDQTYSASTLESWYYLWRHQGFEALQPCFSLGELLSVEIHASGYDRHYAPLDAVLHPSNFVRFRESWSLSKDPMDDPRRMTKGVVGT